MAFNNKNIALLAHLQDLAQRTDTLIQILNSRYDTEAYARIEDNDFLQHKGLSQEKLAELVKVSPMTVRRWEWGLREPRLEEIKRLSNVLHVTESELLNGSQDGKVTLGNAPCVMQSFSSWKVLQKNHSGLKH